MKSCPEWLAVVACVFCYANGFIFGRITAALGRYPWLFPAKGPRP